MNDTRVPTRDAPSRTARKLAVLEAVGDVDGWLLADDVFKLYDLAYEAAGPILEIGTFHGRSAIAMAMALRDAGNPAPLVSLDVDPEALAAAGRTPGARAFPGASRWSAAARRRSSAPRRASCPPWCSWTATTRPPVRRATCGRSSPTSPTAGSCSCTTTPTRATPTRPRSSTGSARRWGRPGWGASARTWACSGSVACSGAASAGPGP